MSYSERSIYVTIKLIGKKSEHIINSDIYIVNGWYASSRKNIING